VRPVAGLEAAYHRADKAIQNIVGDPPCLPRSTEAMMVDRTPEIATLLRQKPAAEGRIQGIGHHNATKAALDVVGKRPS
jgi:hypothetical protein